MYEDKIWKDVRIGNLISGGVPRGELPCVLASTVRASSRCVNDGET
jgi:hypothetical protein